MLNLYRLNYCTTAMFLLAGSVMVLCETDEHNFPNSPQNSDNKWTPGSKNNGRSHLSVLLAQNSDPHQYPPTGPSLNPDARNDTEEYKMYMQVAETILTMLRLSPLLAQEVQRCLNESKTFHEIMSHFPRGLPTDDDALETFGAEKSSKKVNQNKR